MTTEDILLLRKLVGKMGVGLLRLQVQVPLEGRRDEMIGRRNGRGMAGIHLAEMNLTVNGQEVTREAVCPRPHSSRNSADRTAERAVLEMTTVTPSMSEVKMSEVKPGVDTAVQGAQDINGAAAPCNSYDRTGIGNGAVVVAVVVGDQVISHHHRLILAGVAAVVTAEEWAGTTRPISDVVLTRRRHVLMADVVAEMVVVAGMEPRMQDEVRVVENLGQDEEE